MRDYISKWTKWGITSQNEASVFEKNKNTTKYIGKRYESLREHDCLHHTPTVSTNSKTKNDDVKGRIRR